MEIEGKNLVELQKLIDKRVFFSGAVRGDNKGKTRPDLIPIYTLRRIGQHLANGAVKYGENNWLKGIDSKTYKESLMRHVLSALNDETDEDHLSAICFNAFGLMLNQEKEGISYNKFSKVL